MERGDGVDAELVGERVFVLATAMALLDLHSLGFSRQRWLLDKEVEVC